MNVFGWLVWGLAGTVVLTTLMAGSQGLGVTRMNIPYLLGTMLTPNRDRARIYGIAVHLVNGWLFSLVYVAALHAADRFTWWFGALIGLTHGAFVLVVGMPAMPAVHPRMASELRGPTVVRQLEPPGFLARNYGLRTPLSVLFAHVVFGAIIGGFYHPAAGDDPARSRPGPRWNVSPVSSRSSSATAAPRRSAPPSSPASSRARSGSTPAKVAHPDRVAVAVAGDGAMQMNGLNELITVSKYWKRWEDPRLVALILNNHDLNMVTWEQRAMAGDPKLPGLSGPARLPLPRASGILRQSWKPLVDSLLPRRRP